MLAVCADLGWGIGGFVLGAIVAMLVIGWAFKLTPRRW
jgi:hypothetical protein